MITLPEFSIAAAFGFLLVFARIGGGLMLLPAIGEMFVSSRSRVALAVLITMILLPVVSPMVPLPTDQPLKVVSLLISETIIGVFIGALARMVLAALHAAGMIMASQSGLLSATLFDPNQGTQSSLEGNFLSLMAMVMIFSLDLHHVLIETITDSYYLIPIGKPLPIADYADLFSSTLNESFGISLRLAAAHIAIGMLLMIGAGLLSRLMPSMQIFFILLPVQVTLGFTMLMLTCTASMMWYMGYMESKLRLLLP
jgi:flagellar biosynthetic protein FliR